MRSIRNSSESAAVIRSASTFLRCSKIDKLIEILNEHKMIIVLFQVWVTSAGWASQSRLLTRLGIRVIRVRRWRRQSHQIPWSDNRYFRPPVRRFPPLTKKLSPPRPSVPIGSRKVSFKSFTRDKFCCEFIVDLFFRYLDQFDIISDFFGSFQTHFWITYQDVSISH